MADGMKTLDKPMSAILEPGEQLLGGCKAAGRNAVLKTAIGGVAGAAIPGGGGPSGGLADAVPQDKVFWIAVTNHRLVYFGVGALTSAPKSVRGATPLNAIAAVKVQRRKVFRRLELAFKDGSSATVDLYRANSPDSAQQALDSVLPGLVTEASDS